MRLLSVYEGSGLLVGYGGAIGKALVHGISGVFLDWEMFAPLIMSICFECVSIEVALI